MGSSDFFLYIYFAQYFISNDVYSPVHIIGVFYGLRRCRISALNSLKDSELSNSQIRKSSSNILYFVAKRYLDKGKFLLSKCLLFSICSKLFVHFFKLRHPIQSIMRAIKV